MPMKNKLPVLDVIDCRALPSRCPACGRAGAPTSDGQTPVTRLSCDHCHWFARYRVRTPEATTL